MNRKYIWIIGILILVILLVSCSKEDTSLDDKLRPLLAKANVTQLDSGPIPDPNKVELGRLLMYDKILSGNKDISCSTCHRDTLVTSDELSLSIGTGGLGSGQNRVLGHGRSRIPRNAPEVFNRGSLEWNTMFWDSRVSGNLTDGFVTPAGDSLPNGVENVVAAQAMFPLTSRGEMRGNKGDLDVNGAVNEIALIDDMDFVSIWESLAQRVFAIDEYKRRFVEVYPNVPQEELGIQHIANAIAAFEIDAWTFLESPWDLYLAGDKNALSDAAKRGAIIFYDENKSKCSVCHTGNLMTDQEHHNIGIPQLGPGKGDSAPLDQGLFLITGKEEDKFAFRTPPLRNVSETNPFMHNGAYLTLEEVVEHYDDVEKALRNYDPSGLEPSLQTTVKNDSGTLNALLDNLDQDVKDPLDLTEREKQDLITFLEALKDPKIDDLPSEVPESVPSGLPVKD